MIHVSDRSTSNIKISSGDRSGTALIARGALAREVIAIRNKFVWQADVLAVPALLHNWPERIPPGLYI